MSHARNWSPETQLELEKAGWSPLRREAQQLDDWKRTKLEEDLLSSSGQCERTVLSKGTYTPQSKLFFAGDVRSQGPGTYFPANSVMTAMTSPAMVSHKPVLALCCDLACRSVS